MRIPDHLNGLLMMIEHVQKKFPIPALSSFKNEEGPVNLKRM